MAANSIARSNDRHGWMALLWVVVATAVVSVVGWLPLSVPPRLLALVVPRQANCSGLELGTPAMYVCNSRIAWLTLISPLVFSLILFVFRRQLGSWLRRWIIPRVPINWRYLAAPMIATAIFAISWSYLHNRTWNRFGLLPEILFPVVVGVFAFSTTQHTSALQERLGPFISRRDRIPRAVRFAAVLVIPSVIAFALARSLTNVDLSSQLIVVISLGVAYIIMVPAKGSLMQGIRNAVRST